jgi:o-succinylbenzoate synthase
MRFCRSGRRISNVSNAIHEQPARIVSMRLSLRRILGSTAGARDAQHHWPIRIGLLLELRLGSWRGLGEASPLPGLSRDSLADTEDALATLDLAALEHALQIATTADALKAAAALLPRSLPSARMALETAVLDLRGRQQRLSAPALLGAQHDGERALAWLVGVQNEHSLDRMRRAAQQGYRHFKVKMGCTENLDAEIVGIRRLRSALGARPRLRLDANRGWAEAAAASACRQLESLDVEFLEEPSSTWTLPAAASPTTPRRLDTQIPLALDESLAGLDAADLEALVQLSGARVLILKPMVLGGLSHCLDLGRRAAALGMEAVVSHSFDGPVALAAAAALALALPTRLAQGLAPHAGLGAWRCVPLPIHDATLRTWKTPGIGYSMEQFA